MPKFLESFLSFPIFAFNKFQFYQKRQGSLGNVGTRRFVFTIFQADNYGTSSGDDEGNCVYNGMGREISQYKYCWQGWEQAYKNNRNMKKGGLGLKTLIGGGLYK